MKNLKLAVMLVVSLVVLSGCVLTEMAHDYFERNVKINKLEDALDVDEKLCDRSVISHLRESRGDDWYEATLKYCREKDEAKVPLLEKANE